MEKFEFTREGKNLFKENHVYDAYQKDEQQEEKKLSLESVEDLLSDTLGGFDDARSKLKQAGNSSIASNLAELKGRIQAVMDRIEGIASRDEITGNFSLKYQGTDRRRSLFLGARDNLLEVADRIESAIAEMAGTGGIKTRRKLERIMSKVQAAAQQIENIPIVGEGNR